MKKINIGWLMILLLLTSCSAEWHLRRSIKLNPKYGDSTKITTIIVRHDTIRDTLFVPSHNFDFTVDSLRNSLDSFNMVYNDSFVIIFGKLDSIGRLKFRGKVKEKLIPFEVIVHDTIKVDSKCPPSITVNSGYPKRYFWLLIVVFVTLLLLALRK
jgi:hypothetical protein